MSDWNDAISRKCKHTWPGKRLDMSCAECEKTMTNKSKIEKAALVVQAEVRDASFAIGRVKGRVRAEEDGKLAAVFLQKGALWLLEIAKEKAVTLLAAMEDPNEQSIYGKMEGGRWIRESDLLEAMGVKEK